MPFTRRFSRKYTITNMARNTAMHLQKNLGDPKSLIHAATRDGFGTGILEAAKKNTQVVALCADVTESVRLAEFESMYPERFFQVGVAEQNLAAIASGLAAEGKIPFAAAYAMFNPGRNWEQIRTTICYNNQPVKIIGSHAGVNVGEDGGTHQALEDIGLMRMLPNMTVVVPADAEQARRMTVFMAQDPSPYYMRLTRAKFPVFTTKRTPLEIGKAQVLRTGSEVTVIACGPLVYEALQAAQELRGSVDVEVINLHTIAPLDAQTLLRSARKTGCVVTAEEHQVAGGMGSAVAELFGKKMPVPMEMVGMQNVFGESGNGNKLMTHFGLDAPGIIRAIRRVSKRRP